METKLSNLNISDKDTDTINTKNCCNAFTKGLWCKECINSLERSAENGIEKNLEKAFYWYQKAAENGFTNAMYYLAICYDNGEGTEKNLEKAFYWYQKAAENGDKEAMFNLAICYKNGAGTERI
ncbi:unnamed protein product [Rhizophagus irregularis]|nr:unnamed protein product [Rhizophagus irregularis]